jgi:hypothetical protein
MINRQGRELNLYAMAADRIKKSIHTASEDTGESRLLLKVRKDISKVNLDYNSCRPMDCLLILQKKLQAR